MLLDKLFKYAGEGSLIGLGGKGKVGIKLTSNTPSLAQDKSQTLAGGQTKPSINSYKPQSSNNKLGQPIKHMKFDMNNFTSGPNAK